ncbi:hypothetical protein V6N11_042514 [Hibiscus sabdariffa]|uniref:Myb-like domain-containing protein n=1 Tax=Hibiscus sabdariffa TaxID=183260 RepID=A0ABR2QWP3_9ROSI
MAESEHSSSENASMDTTEEHRHSKQDSELEFSDDEETLIIRMFNLVGERWSLIAGRIPGRTAEEIENFSSENGGNIGFGYFNVSPSSAPRRENVVRGGATGGRRSRMRRRPAAGGASTSSASAAKGKWFARSNDGMLPPIVAVVEVFVYRMSMRKLLMEVRRKVKEMCKRNSKKVKHNEGLKRLLESQGRLNRIDDSVRQRNSPKSPVLVFFSLTKSQMYSFGRSCCRIQIENLGVMDDGGKYMYISMDEMKAIGISHLASKSNQFIDSEPKVQFAEVIGAAEETGVARFDCILFLFSLMCRKNIAVVS